MPKRHLLSTFKPSFFQSLHHLIPIRNIERSHHRIDQHTESGKITLEFKKRSAHSGQFIVTDTGTGIPEEKRANLFKPFAEVQDLTKGDGLGLPTCSLIAYKLNGTLRLDEEYKKGTRFVLELRS